MESRPTISTLLGSAAEDLAGVTSARLDAEVLLQYVLGVERSWFYAHSEVILDVAQSSTFLALVSRRREGFPVAYLTGTREFWSLPLQVNRHTLIPRPESEDLVTSCLNLLGAREHASVLDLGTGSGALALALARERPRWRITGADISVDALAVARENARSLGLESVDFIRSDWFSDLGSRVFDAVVCNPPYVASGDEALISGELRFEPRLALDGGHAGLDALRQVTATAFRHLEYGGYLLLEHGHEHGESVRQLLTCNGYAEIATIQDSAGLDRISRGRR